MLVAVAHAQHEAARRWRLTVVEAQVVAVVAAGNGNNNNIKAWPLVVRQPVASPLHLAVSRLHSLVPDRRQLDAVAQSKRAPAAAASVPQFLFNNSNNKLFSVNSSHSSKQCLACSRRWRSAWAALTRLAKRARVAVEGAVLAEAVAVAVVVARLWIWMIRRNRALAHRSTSTNNFNNSSKCSAASRLRSQTLRRSLAVALSPCNGRYRLLHLVDSE